VVDYNGPASFWAWAATLLAVNRLTLREQFSSQRRAGSDGSLAQLTGWLALAGVEAAMNTKTTRALFWLVLCSFMLFIRLIQQRGY